jgi:glutamine synthetase
MTIDEFLADPESRFATVAMTDTNGLLRGQMVSRRSLKGIARNGMGMSPVTLALDPTDVVLNIPGVSDDTSDFHDDPLVLDPSTVRTLPWSKPGHDLLVLANYSGGTANLCPRSLLKRVLERVWRCRLHALLRHGARIYPVRRDAGKRARQGLSQPQDRDAAQQPRPRALPGAADRMVRGVAEMCEPLGISLAKMHEEIGGGFLEACIAAGRGARSPPTSWCCSRTSSARWPSARENASPSCRAGPRPPTASRSMSMSRSRISRARRSSTMPPAQERRRRDLPPLHRRAAAYIGDMTLFQPTVNSYRRFAPGTFAPPGLTWGFENRTTCFRIVGHDAGSLRVENRLPGADTNPYLTVAATIAAGVAGVLEKIEPDPETIGNGYSQDMRRATSPARCPRRSSGYAVRPSRATGSATASSRRSRRRARANTTNSARRFPTWNWSASSTWGEPPWIPN